MGTFEIKGDCAVTYGKWNVFSLVFPLHPLPLTSVKLEAHSRPIYDLITNDK